MKMNPHSNGTTILELFVGSIVGIFGFAVRVTTEKINIWSDLDKTALHAVVAALVGATLTFFITKFWKWFWIKLFKK